MTNPIHPDTQTIWQKVGVADSNDPSNVLTPNNTRAAVLTKSNSTVYTPPYNGLYVGGTGDVAVHTIGGDTVTFSAVPTGQIIPIQFDQLLSTGTTATFVVGMR